MRCEFKKNAQMYKTVPTIWMPMKKSIFLSVASNVEESAFLAIRAMAAMPRTHIPPKAETKMMFKVRMRLLLRMRTTSLSSAKSSGTHGRRAYDQSPPISTKRGGMSVIAPAPTKKSYPSWMGLVKRTLNNVVTTSFAQIMKVTYVDEIDHGTSSNWKKLPR